MTAEARPHPFPTAIELSPAAGPHWQALNLNLNRNLARLRFLEIKSKIMIKIGKKPFRLNSMAVHPVPLPFRRGEGARRAGEGPVLLPERRRFWAVAVIGRRDDHATNDMILRPPRQAGSLSYFGHWPPDVSRRRNFAGSMTTCLMRSRFQV